MVRRALVFILALAVFAVGLGVLGLLNRIPSTKEKMALAKLRLEEESLSRSFEILVVRTGFQRKSTGARDVYVPCLLVQAVNTSPQTSKRATLRADFLRNGRTFCMAAGSVPALEPEAGCELWLKCIELTGFGSVAWGLSLAETTEPMDFVIHLETSRASVVVAKDRLKSILL
jgi:hypothetical protein